MLSRLDKGVRAVVRRLKTSGMWERTLLVFSTDNGGAVSRSGSNHPLRGTKGTLFEGGTHGVGFVAGGFLGRKKGVTHGGLFHITDWYPTLLAAATDTEDHNDGRPMYGEFDDDEARGDPMRQPSTKTKTPAKPPPD